MTTARHASRTILAATAVLVMSALPLHLLSGLSVLMAAELDFNVRELGLAVSVYFGASAACALPAGVVVRRTGPRLALAWATALIAGVLMGIGGIASSWTHTLALLGAAGISAALIQVGSNVMLATHVPRNRQGLAFGVKMAAIPGAAILAGIALPAIGLTVGWRAAFVMAAVLAILVILLLPPTEAAAVQAESARREDARLRPLLVIALGSALGSAAGTSVTPFLVPFLVGSGYPLASAGLALATGSMIGAAARIAFGWTADRVPVGALALAATALAAGAVGYVTLTLAAGPVLLVLAVALAFGGGFGWAGLVILAVARANPNSPVRALALLQAATFGGAIVGPAAFGLLADAISFDVAWRTMALVLGVAAATLILSRRILIRDQRRQVHLVPTSW